MKTYEVTSVLERLLGVVEERQSQGGVEYLGTPTGLSQIDLHTGGLQPDQQWLVGAATGGGKSALGLDITLNVARTKPSETALFFSLEMSSEMLVNRLLSRMTEIPAGKIIRGKLSGKEMKEVHLAAEELGDLNIHFIDQTINTEQLRAYSMTIAEKVPVSMVTVDYVGLLTDRGDHGETERIGKISRELRNLARPDQLNTPVLSLVQLNRTSQSGETRRPALHHIKSTSNLEQDANVVLLLYRPALEQQERGAAPKTIEDAEIIIAKNREGEMLSTKAKFYPRLMKWKQ